MAVAAMMTMMAMMMGVAVLSWLLMADLLMLNTVFLATIEESYNIITIIIITTYTYTAAGRVSNG